MAGSREKAWGEKKKFREGQSEQILDDLFFHFIETARILQPKVVVAENVKGLIVGKARGYVKQIFNLFNLAGYDTQLFLLNASAMGVPQARERTIFIARRRDLDLPAIRLSFNEPVITFRDIKEKDVKGKLTDSLRRLWDHRKPTDLHAGQINDRLTGNKSRFTTMIQQDHRPLYTITASDQNVLYSEPRHLTELEVILGQTFPLDYKFNGQKAQYVCGMSVPPFMMQRVANEIHKQLLKR